MVIVKLPDEETQKRALAVLIGQYPGHSWASGEMVVPEEALAPMALAGITFTVEGRATHERIQSLRNTPALAV
jgi:hypothetical protein